MVKHYPPCEFRPSRSSLYLIVLQMQEWGWFDMSCIGSPQVLVIGPQILIFCPVPSQGTQISCLIFRPSQTRMVVSCSPTFLVSKMGSMTSQLLTIDI